MVNRTSNCEDYVTIKNNTIIKDIKAVNIEIKIKLYRKIQLLLLLLNYVIDENKCTHFVSSNSFYNK